ncbi:hypothetical protein AB0I77_15875 [Streptomyces sp. NPDC050619]|uniref:hypothetical protein n=1 Tax=Streptomyces sp. NPDC050619 TaxID=3157214 RepID=UPI003431D026
MQDEGQELRAILGEEQIALLSRVNQLAEMAEEAFLETVMAEAKGRADPVTALALRHPDMRVRWLKAIKSAITALDRQFAQNKDDPDAKDWRKRANTVHSSLRQRKYEAEAANPRNRHKAEAPERRERRLEESAAERRRRGEVGQLAVQRLREAHPEEFDAYLAEEYHKADIKLPDALARRIASGSDDSHEPQTGHGPLVPSRPGRQMPLNVRPLSHHERAV